jgi:hypothetical protein
MGFFNIRIPFIKYRPVNSSMKSPSNTFNKNRAAKNKKNQKIKVYNPNPSGYLVRGDIGKKKPILH